MDHTFPSSLAKLGEAAHRLAACGTAYLRARWRCDGVYVTEVLCTFVYERVVESEACDGASMCWGRTDISYKRLDNGQPGDRWRRDATTEIMIYKS